MPYIQAAVEAVFSTYVEVIPIFLALTKRLCRILHVCGGDPSIKINISTNIEYSPRMWR